MPPAARTASIHSAPGQPGRRAARRGDRRPHRRVAGMGEALDGQRVEHRPGQRRILQRRLQRLALRPQRRVARVGPQPARTRPAPVCRRRRGAPRLAPSACRAAGASSRTRPTTCATSSQPTQPASWRAYSSRSVGSLIRATIGTQRRSAGDPALGGVQVVLGKRGADRELEQRRAPGHQVAQRAVAGLQPQIARVHAVGGDRDEGLPGQVLLAVERLERRRAARGVTVEDVDQLAAKEVVVHHESAQHRQVLVAERGAARRDGRRHPGEVHRHHVGVALDDDRLVPLGDVPLGQVEAEQHRRLLVQHRLRGVDVLGLHLVVVEDAAGAEADDLAAAGPDRPQQAAVEAVHRAAPALPRQPGGLELLELKTLAQQVLCQRVPARRGEPAAEVARRPRRRSCARSGTARAGAASSDFSASA